VLTQFAYRMNDFNFGLSWRHLPSVENAAIVTLPTSTVQGTGSYNLINLHAGYALGRYAFRVGIDNVFDKEPLVVGFNPGANPNGPIVDSNSDVTNPSFYDPLGRRYYVGVKASF
jgi:iron complex outermembrane receptor protein